MLDLCISFHIKITPYFNYNDIIYNLYFFIFSLI